MTSDFELRGDTTVRGMAQAAKKASRVLATLSTAQRNAALEAMARSIETATEDLLAANADDLEAAHSLREGEALSSSTLSRLTLSQTRLEEMVAQIRAVAALPDPLGRVLDATELDDRDPDAFARSNGEGLHLTKVSVPLGVLAVIFEARPDAVTQIVSLGIKSGNAVLLKPGSEVEGTAEAIVDVLREAFVSQGLPKAAVSLVRGRENVAQLLKADDLVDMVIPRGSKKLVEFVQANTRIPVLGHAEGVCHIYVDRTFDEAMALRVIEDAKCDYPAACNAVETVLVHRDIAKTFLPRLTERLRSRSVRIHTTDDAGAFFYGADPRVQDWHTEYGELAVSIGVVDSLDAAIDHIHTHGSSHTESIITEDATAAERFLNEVDAAGVLHNASTRFADGFRYGFGAEVGISTSKFHARGPVGLDGLTTYKYVVCGHGHIAADYRGKNARAFTHRKETAP